MKSNRSSNEILKITSRIYDPRPPLEPRYPAVRPSEGENVRPEELIGLADKSLLHAPPGYVCV